MGKSVLLLDPSNNRKTSNDLNGNKNGEETVLNMDLMQKQQVQRTLILNEEVN